MKTQNNKQSFRSVALFYLLGMACCSLLPLLYIHQQYDRWNPYRLNGKKFLVFYIMVLLLCHAARVLERIITPETYRLRFWSRILPTAVLLTGLTRLIQGISNAKPVGFLILLLLLHLVVNAMISNQAKAVQ